jgi:dephospho-CoA kinase
MGRWQLMPFQVAVSGGIAAGKSTVCETFAELGASIIDADVIARELVAPGQSALAEIAAQFGKNIINSDGTLDRSALRQLVFEKPDAKSRLEAILHPRIQAELHRQSTQVASGIVVVAIPLLTPASRSSAYAWLQRVLIVEAPRHIQIDRIAARDGSSTALAEAMVASQLDTAGRLPMADDVFINDGNLLQLQEWARQLFTRYQHLAFKAQKP